MSDVVIETEGLRKEFRTRRGRTIVAVDGLDLAVPRGGVHGFLGPNGSGKTTTIRMLLGLVRPTSGSIRVLGEEVPRRLPRVISRVGALVEEPAFLGSFSGRTNLDLLARQAGAARSRVDDVLARVGLEQRAGDRYRTYSLGMRQRLALGAALLTEPDLLVLDEPTNGLDPAGMRDVRRLVRELAGGGVTVLLSSHLLAEVQQVCDSVSIVARGRLLSSGTVRDLVGRDAVPGARLRVHDTTRAQEVLAAAGWRVQRDGAHLLVESVPDPAAVTRVLADAGLYLSELQPDRPDLESVFLDLTADAPPGPAPAPGPTPTTPPRGGWQPPEEGS